MCVCVKNKTFSKCVMHFLKAMICPYRTKDKYKYRLNYFVNFNLNTFLGSTKTHKGVYNKTLKLLYLTYNVIYLLVKNYQLGFLLFVIYVIFYLFCMIIIFFYYFSMFIYRKTVIIFPSKTQLYFMIIQIYKIFHCSTINL